MSYNNYGGSGGGGGAYRDNGYGGQGGGYGGNQGGYSDNGGGAGGGAGGYNTQYSNYSAQDLQATGQGGRWGNDDGAYAPLNASSNAPRNSLWLEKQQARSQRSKWIIVGIVALLAIIGIGAGVGVAVTHKSNVAAVKPSNNNNSSDSNSTGGSSSSGNPTNSDPNDPSKFDQNPAFHKIFYGMAYTPVGSIMPECGAKLDEVITDVQLMSQLTDKIRLYGSDCNITHLVLDAIKQTKVDMKVYLGNYIAFADQAAYTRQKTALEDALSKFGSDNILGITVGNEVMLNACADVNGTDPNAADVQPTANYIVQCIQDTRTSLQAAGHSNIKVGNSDAGSYFSTAVLNVADYGMSNVHPWFAHTTVTDSVNWTLNFFQENNVGPAALLPSHPQMLLAEIGWPTGSKEPEKGNTGVGAGGEASIQNLQTFLDSFVCHANSNNIPYFYFELFDELWKDIKFGGVEGYWGLLDSNKKLKSGITIPTCS